MTVAKRASACDTGPQKKTTTIGFPRSTSEIATSTAPRRRGGRAPRRKGNRLERELVHRHQDLGIRAERYPLSGATHFRGSGHDLDLYIWGSDAAPAVAEVKGRANGAGFATLERWLGEYDLLVLRRNHADPMVVLPWRVWVRLLERVRR